MSSRPSSRPSITEPWPRYRRLTMHLSSDRIFFRSVNSRGIPEGVGAGNAGKHCTVILGHKKIKGIQKVKEFRDLQVYTGLSIELFPEDEVFSCIINSIGAPSSVGIRNAGKDITIIVHC
jgi:hypothetical protein